MRQFAFVLLMAACARQDMRAGATAPGNLVVAGYNVDSGQPVNLATDPAGQMIVSLMPPDGGYRAGLSAGNIVAAGVNIDSGVATQLATDPSGQLILSPLSGGGSSSGGLSNFDGGSVVAIAPFWSAGSEYAIDIRGPLDGGSGINMQIGMDADPSFLGLAVLDTANPLRTRTNYVLIASPPDLANDTWVNVETSGTVGLRVHDNGVWYCNAGPSATCILGSAGAPGQGGKIFLNGAADSFASIGVSSEFTVVDGDAGIIFQYQGSNEMVMTGTSFGFALPLLVNGNPVVSLGGLDGGSPPLTNVLPESGSVPISAATSVSSNFNHTFSGAPTCVCGVGHAVAVINITGCSASTTAVTITTLATATGTLSYICTGS